MFGRKKRDEPPAPPAAAAIDDLRDSIHLEAQRLEHAPVDLPLVRARLADRCRDAGVTPPDPGPLLAAAEALDLEGQRRLAALVCGLEDQPPTLLAGAPVGDAVAQVFVKQATEDALLTRAVLAMSALRAEEAARRLCAGLGVAIEGETPQASRAALARLDYRRLLAEADLARADAQDRVAHLLKLAEEEAAHRRPRGKW